MRLTVYSDYALRLMMYVGLKGERLTTIAEIADAYDISRAHLMKITNELAQKGLIETVRGRQGGMRLAKPAQTIGVGDVVRACEPDFALVPCMENGGAAIVCAVQPACVLKRVLGSAAAAFLEVLDGYTLDDLLRPSVPLRKLLQIDIPAPPN